ncbi:hypothetical protein COT87_03110 [Candidatus Collierbacteria bacterium CG10_big_fil_rev_8_21_14_0_10_44_9]|uniref:Uncharacterized protein n=1 Tax=Candidatus Collierbacteria bacterium CG10_big_fil_rev_8_21_14_0_10_44_9 TaxID=1974535 RepID=A0A2H0VI42_9BACT|nr:MAG: hypothetical protein COT87_03110 [Candidatus Collierbacteria bacterium CG10_big_fil_rev_8_21_14_0_10_44_9]
MKGLGKVHIELVDDISEKYSLIEKTVKKFKYKRLAKHDKKTVLIYLRHLTGYHKAQLLRLIKRVLGGEHLERTCYIRHNSQCVYTPGDIKLLEYTDAVHHRLNSLCLTNSSLNKPSPGAVTVTITHSSSPRTVASSARILVMTM